VFHGCRIYENVLPGVAIRTAGHPIIHGCSIVTGKDSALMVCDKGKGIILESALKGYSARPLEIRDGCSPIIQFCELHDGKHRHVMEWLQQIPKSIKPSDIEALGWSDEQLAAEDMEAMESSPLCRELGNGDGKIVIIGEDTPIDKAGVDITPDNEKKLEMEIAPAPNVVTTTTTVPNAMENDNEDVRSVISDDGKIAKNDAPAAKNTNEKIEEKKKEESHEKEEQPSKPKEKSENANKKGDKKKGGKGKVEKKSDSGSSDEQTSSITLSGKSTTDGDDEPVEDPSESSEESSTVSNGDVLSSSSSGDSAPKNNTPPPKKGHKKGHSHKRSAEKGGKSKKPTPDGKKSKSKKT